MYGRCETDPFDFAVDVCSSCWGEYCEKCIASADRRRPLCRDCALVKAGVRQGRIVARGDKKSVKKRRAELQAKAAERTDTFALLPPPGSAGDDADDHQPRERWEQEPEPIAPQIEPFDQQAGQEADQESAPAVPTPEREPVPEPESAQPRRGLAALAERLQSGDR